MSSPSSYLAMDVSSYFTIPAFGRHVTIFKYCHVIECDYRLGLDWYSALLGTYTYKQVLLFTRTRMFSVMLYKKSSTPCLAQSINGLRDERLTQKYASSLRLTSL
jgi:hypothetical protein